MELLNVDSAVYDELVEFSESMSTSALWGEVIYFLGEKSPYEERKQLFLSILYRLTQEGRIKLAFDGKFLEGTIEEQVQLYSDRWPKDERKLAGFGFQFTEDKHGNLIEFWPMCGFVWIYEDGSMEGT